MSELTFGSLFAGIGGIDLGFERAGLKCLWQCEVDPYCNRVLEKHWPETERFGDIHQLDAATPRPDVLVGGFPCQPVSVAGRRKAQADSRWLWPEFARLIGDLQPAYVVGENVRGLSSKGLDEVLADLTRLGYDAEWQVVSAASVGAPHLRERIFIVGYPNCSGLEGYGRLIEGTREGTIAATSVQADVADADDGRRLGWARNLTEEDGRNESPYRSWWEFEPDVGRVANGVPNRVDRLRALGNAVVPQVAEYVGRLLVEHNRRQFEIEFGQP